LSLVDPDNRRPVDFDARRRLLKEIEALPLEEIWRRRAEGLPKLYLIAKVLRVREQFAGAGYEPLAVRGANAEAVVAFMRGAAVVAVPRLTRDWSETVVELPPGKWQNQLTGETWSGKRMPLGKAFARFPVAFFLRGF